MTATNGQGELGDLSPAESFRLGTEALNARNYPAAHRYLQAAVERERTADHLSQYALALVHHTGNLHAAVALCQEAVKKEPRDAEQYLRMGTVYLVGGRKREAVRILNLGLRVGRHPGITRLLQILGQRKRPVLPFLSRNNPLNKYLGKIRSGRS